MQALVVEASSERDARLAAADYPGREDAEVIAFDEDETCVVDAAKVPKEWRVPANSFGVAGASGRIWHDEHLP